ncbi:hypothetical protein [Desulfomicrobium baculatum]|uniref:hypothetical protein n=1 Tax=Desulfomicrobium baculatum TaxID=899 RepID=UPI00117F40F5|nr:hypothetical protein [Desulfomicrobium baculatum]
MNTKKRISIDDAYTEYCGPCDKTMGIGLSIQYDHKGKKLSIACSREVAVAAVFIASGHGQDIFAHIMKFIC